MVKHILLAFIVLFSLQGYAATEMFTELRSLPNDLKPLSPRGLKVMEEGACTARSDSPVDGNVGLPLDELLETGATGLKSEFRNTLSILLAHGAAKKELSGGAAKLRPARVSETTSPVSSVGTGAAKLSAAVKLTSLPERRQQPPRLNQTVNQPARHGEWSCEKLVQSPLSVMGIIMVVILVPCMMDIINYCLSGQVAA